jgi:hypothetical protein
VGNARWSIEAMRSYGCQACGATVRRAKFCSRCGGRQPLRVLRGVMAGISASALVAVFAVAFASLGRSVPEFKPSPPSGGTWAGEADLGPLDFVPGTSSLFAPLPGSASDQSAASVKSSTTF